MLPVITGTNRAFKWFSKHVHVSRIFLVNCSLIYKIKSTKSTVSSMIMKWSECLNPPTDFNHLIIRHWTNMSNLRKLTLRTAFHLERKWKYLFQLHPGCFFNLRIHEKLWLHGTCSSIRTENVPVQLYMYICIICCQSHLMYTFNKCLNASVQVKAN